VTETKYESLEQLAERKRLVEEQINSLDLSTAGRKFSTEQREVWNELHAEREELTETIEERRVRERQLRMMADRGDPAAVTPAFEFPGDDSRRGLLVRDQALRANERASFLPDASKAKMEATLRADDDEANGLARYVVETSSRDYFRAFASWMRDPVSGGHEWTDAEREAVKRVKHLERAMALGAGGTGGFLVPYELDPSVLITGAGAVSPLREIGRVVTTALNEKRFVTSLGVTSTWTPEATEQTDDSPALLQPTITCKKGAAFVPVSFELFEDSGIAQELGRLLADAKLVQEALGFTLTQSNGPVGIITSLVAAGGSTVIATGTNVLAQGDLYANQAALPARWRPNAKWMMNLSILNGYRQLPQATGLNYSIVDDSGPLPKALGWPIYENSSMDGTLTGSAADYLVLSGDFGQFAIVDRIGTSVEIIPHLVGTNHRPTAQRGVYMHFRVGSDVLIPDAFRLSNFST
jgi:HK97 family phage major capsid protein